MRRTRSWIAPGIITAAVAGTAALSVAAAGPLTSAKATILPTAKTAAATAATSGWQVVAKVGPASSVAGDSISGSVSARGAKAAWAVWPGKGPAIVDRWTGSKWAQVKVPAKLDLYVASTVAFDGQAGYLWLFSDYQPTQALLYSDGKWTVEKLPSWVLRKSGSNGYDISTAVFSKSNVWVFSLGTGGYAAHFNGKTWSKVTMPGVAEAVAPTAENDIWALGKNALMHWTGHGWQNVSLPPAFTGVAPDNELTYSGITATSAKDVTLVTELTDSSNTVQDKWFAWHWNGKSWADFRGPGNFVGAVTPDGQGGLWAETLEDNPGGFWTLSHLSGGKWTTAKLPSGLWTQAPLTLTQIPGTKSVWATGTELPTQTGGKGLILRYNP